MLAHGEMFGLCKYMDVGVLSRPTQIGKCHEVNFVVNGRYTNLHKKYKRWNKRLILWLQRKLHFIYTKISCTFYRQMI